MKALCYCQFMCPECGCIMLNVPDTPGTEKYMVCRFEDCKLKDIKFKFPGIELERVEEESRVRHLVDGKEVSELEGLRVELEGVWLCYTILRRLAQGKIIGSDGFFVSPPQTITIEHLRDICKELEGKTPDELRAIHKREIGDCSPLGD